MCLAIAPLLSVVGTAVSAAGAIAQGNQAAAAAEAQAKAIEQQAQAQQAADAFEASQLDRRNRLQQANARAQVGASGVGFEGSPAAVLAANAGQGQLDLEAIRFGSVLKQNNLQTQAELSRMQGRQARTAGFINAATGFIGGASQLYDPNRSIRMGQNPFA
jgi:hypothetical protein